jgi:hypothetical protein
MSAKIKYAKAPVTYLAIAFVVLAALKLAGVIAWSWWLVTLPLWGLMAAALVIAIIRTIIDLLTSRSSF